MKNIVVIPARYSSTRLPGKPLIEIGGKPIVQWVYEKALESRFKDGVIIATDDERIKEAVISFGADVVMTSPTCESGTDRVYEAVRERHADVVVNLQGDEPFIKPEMIDALFSLMNAEHLNMATLCSVLKDEKEYNDPNTVKVVLDRFGFALYFSRSPVPFIRNRTEAQIYKHIGIYSYSREFLEEFVNMEKGVLEKAESLEQLRALENGYDIKVFVTEYEGFGIDTKEDLERANIFLKKD